MAASTRAEISWSGRPAASQWSATSAGSTPGVAVHRLGEAGVHLRGLTRHQPSRDGLHEERMGELDVVAGAGPEQATPREQVQRLVHRLLRKSRGGTEHAGRHPALGDPQHPHHPPRHVVEVADAPVEEVGEGAGQRGVVRTRGELAVYSGRPWLRGWMRRARSSAPRPRSSRSCSAVSAGVSGGTSTTVTPSVQRARVSQSVCTSDTSGSSTRHVATTGGRDGLVMRCVSRSRVLRSAQWRSSRCTASGRPSASARRVLPTDAKSRSRPQRSSGARRPSRRRARAAASPARWPRRSGMPPVPPPSTDRRARAPRGGHRPPA